jgi:hypothetical protein
VFRGLGADDKPDPNRTYTAMLNPDGSFELVASGGELPAGVYQVTVDIAGKVGEKYKAFATRRELKPGANDLTLDLARPNE